MIGSRGRNSGRSKGGGDGASGGVASPFATRPLAPLALTLGLHLLLVLVWMWGASSGPQPKARRQAARESTFVLVRPPSVLQPSPKPKPTSPVVATAARPRTAAPVHIPAPLPAAASPASPAPPAAPAASEPLQAEPPAEAPASALPGDLLATSKRMAGGVDRLLRAGGSPITAEPDRKWERFAAAFAQARASVTRDTVLESYTAGDGVIIYRKTVGNRVACYRSGSVGALARGDGRAAGNVPCPSSASWTRH